MTGHQRQKMADTIRMTGFYKATPTAVLAAHNMHARGLKPLEIAARVGYSSRSIARWLKQPVPQPAILGEWADRAACLNHPDPDLFFPHRGDQGAQAAAKAVCDQCPVRIACLDHALTHQETGIWGGLNDHQRRQLRQAGL